MVENKTVQAVGTATATKKRGNPIEDLMSAEIHKISAEADAIWKDPNLKDAEKQEKIKKLTSDDNVRARKLAVRKAYRDEQLRRSHETSAAAQVEALKNAAAALK